MPEEWSRQLWLRGQRRPRKQRLSLERVVEGAIALLDTEGVAGFSMRRLAARLEAGTMSLYEYVSAREDVLDLALDAAIGEIELDDLANEHWRDTLVRLMCRSREVMRRHTWVPTLMGTRPLLGPQSLARSERTYTVLAEAGLVGPRLLAAVSALTGYVQTFTVTENTWRSWVRDATTEAELRRAAQDHIAEHSELYPTLSRHAQLDNADFDGQFLLGLEIILDGVEAQLAG